MEEDTDTQIQSGTFSFEDEKKIKNIFDSTNPNLLIKTTDGSIMSGHYGMLCDNCVDAVFDALKAKTILCSVIPEGHSEQLCPKYVKRFRISWSAPLELQFKFFTMPSAITKPAIYNVIKNVEGMQNLIVLSK